MTLALVIGLLGGCGFDTGVLRLKRTHLFHTKLKGLGQKKPLIIYLPTWCTFHSCASKWAFYWILLQDRKFWHCRKWMIAVAFWVHGLLPLQYVAPHIKVTWWLCFYGNSRVEINISTDIFPVTTGSKWPYIFLYH